MERAGPGGSRPQGRTLTAQISYRNTGATPEANPEIVFVTTDAKHQVIRVKLRLR